MDVFKVFSVFLRFILCTWSLWILPWSLCASSLPRFFWIYVFPSWTAQFFFLINLILLLPIGSLRVEPGILSNIYYDSCGNTSADHLPLKFSKSPLFRKNMSKMILNLDFFFKISVLLLLLELLIQHLDLEHCLFFTQPFRENNSDVLKFISV